MQLASSIPTQTPCLVVVPSTPAPATSHPLCLLAQRSAPARPPIINNSTEPCSAQAQCSSSFQILLLPLLFVSLDHSARSRLSVIGKYLSTSTLILADRESLVLDTRSRESSRDEQTWRDPHRIHDQERLASLPHFFQWCYIYTLYICMAWRGRLPALHLRSCFLLFVPQPLETLVLAP